MSGAGNVGSRGSGNSTTISTTTVITAGNGVDAEDLKIDYVTFQKSGDALVGDELFLWESSYNCIIREINASVGTAPTGDNIVLHINKYNYLSNTSSELGTLTINAGALRNGSGVISYALAINDRIAIDVASVGSTIAGANMIITLKIERN
jgi:hypothetical protein